MRTEAEIVVAVASMVEPVAYVRPPYSRRLAAWIGEFLAKRTTPTVLMLPARTDTQWWKAVGLTCEGLCFIRGRVKFDGHRTGAPFPSALVYFGHDPDSFFDSVFPLGTCYRHTLHPDHGCVLPERSE